MRLTEASVVIRPRSAWEAMDLGVLLARRHAGLLMLAWALLTLPLLALLSLLLWNSPGWALLIFWWLKPAYERLPLYILSRTLFGETPSMRQAFRELPRQLRPELLASLTWRRFSPTRSFGLPVAQLEGGSRPARRQRRDVLSGNGGSRGAGLLTVVGMHLEMILWLGLVTLLYLLIPQQATLDFDWQRLLEGGGSDWLWLEHLSNLLYALVLVIWEPVYVACGFSLYLNRRTILEGWDIELAFRRLHQRLSGAALALPLAFALLLQLPDAAWAQASPDPSSGPQTERLQQQTLPRQEARASIEALLEAPPFSRRETVTRWRFGEQVPQADANPTDWAERFSDLLGIWRSLNSLTRFLEILLWAGLCCFLILLAWRYQDWLRVFTGRLSRPQRRRQRAPEVLFGLPVTPHSLPADIAGEAERLWAEQPRQALALLYRGLLSRLLHDFRLPLKEADTEGEVLERVRQLRQAELERFTQELTLHWQNLAYGHLPPPAHLRDELCSAWRHQFEREAAA